MLKVRFRPAERYKCPRHPRQQYAKGHISPPGCEVCEAIWQVVHALEKLDRVQRRARAERLNWPLTIAKP